MTAMAPYISASNQPKYRAHIDIRATLEESRH